ncbi:MAG: Trm112 family protein [Parvularculaceae bacterium]|nr:Trm112 family protein [Parvularculaceae bacterium]
MEETPRLKEVDPKLLEILVCPATKDRLVYRKEAGELLSRKARLAYPVRDGIPIMLVDEARPLSDEEVLALG